MMGKTWYPTFRHRDPTTDPGGDPSVSQSPQVEGLVPDVQRVTKVGQPLPWRGCKPWWLVRTYGLDISDISGTGKFRQKPCCGHCGYLLTIDQQFSPNDSEVIYQENLPIFGLHSTFLP